MHVCLYVFWNQADGWRKDFRAYALAYAILRIENLINAKLSLICHMRVKFWHLTFCKRDRQERTHPHEGKHAHQQLYVRVHTSKYKWIISIAGKCCQHINISSLFNGGGQYATCMTVEGYIAKFNKKSKIKMFNRNKTNNFNTCTHFYNLKRLISWSFWVYWYCSCCHYRSNYFLWNFLLVLHECMASGTWLHLVLPFRPGLTLLLTNLHLSIYIFSTWTPTCSHYLWQ